MTLSVKISNRAGSQIRRAAQWWIENRPAAPDAIGDDISDCLTLLSGQPGIGTKYEGTRAGMVRRLYLGRVGYFLYYRVCEDVLEVLAFWHASRGGQPKL
jgi:plasmid stabilization system protein ParE